jgi:hypothetical protein
MSGGRSRTRKARKRHEAANPSAPQNAREIYCCGCAADVTARLTDGREVYAHRPDLAALPFWKCDACGNAVGCHHKTDNPTNPLGVIPTPELKEARNHIHRLIDPLWQSKRIGRKELYAKLAAAVEAKSYHTADIRSIEQARAVYRAAQEIAANLPQKGKPE